MKIILPPQAKLFVAKNNNNKYYIKVQIENEIYVHYFPFTVLGNAVKIAYKILNFGKLDLEQYWRKEEESIGKKNDKFLIDYSNKYKAHLWGGLDTFCRIWSTGGLGYNYALFQTNLDRDICKMCFNKQEQTSTLGSARK